MTNKTWSERLEKILDDYAFEIDAVMWKEEMVLVKEAINKLVLELIGEDEEAYLYGSKQQLVLRDADENLENDIAIARNALRIELRKIVGEDK